MNIFERDEVFPKFYVGKAWLKNSAAKHVFYQKRKKTYIGDTLNVLVVPLKYLSIPTVFYSLFFYFGFT